MIKICKKCGESKSLDLFYKSRIYKGTQYYTSWCKCCTNEYSKPYTKKYKHTEKFRKYENEYRLNKMITDPIYHEKVKLAKRESHKRCIVHNLWKRTKDRALKKDIEFDLQETDIQIPLLCPILEIPLFVGTQKNYNNSPTIDRIDNSKGYTKDNIRIISMLANTMKNQATLEELRTFCKNIINYVTNKDIVQTT